MANGGKEEPNLQADWRDVSSAPPRASFSPIVITALLAVISEYTAELGGSPQRESRERRAWRV
jgi:hypothetical protein